MNVSVCASLLIVTAVASTSCARDQDSSSPTGPSGSSNLIVEVRCPEFGESTRCNAYSTVGGRDGQDVTGLASWSTGDPAIATASSTGLVTVHATGEVSIRASYQGASGFALVWAIPGQGLHGTSRILQGTVMSLAGPLPDVVMEILTGPNTGRNMTTSSSGRFYMDGLQDSQFTIRLSKPGYTTAEYVWWIPGGSERYPSLTAR